MDIEDANGSTVHTSGPHTHHWRESGSQVTMQIREGGLRINSHYVANITVSTLVGKAYVSLGFSECMIVFTFPCYYKTITIKEYSLALAYAFMLLVFIYISQFGEFWHCL